MTVIKPIITIIISLEQLLNAVFDQQGTAQYSHDLEDRPADIEFMLDNGNEAIGDDGHMNLYSDCVFRLAPEGYGTNISVGSTMFQLIIILL